MTSEDSKQNYYTLLLIIMNVDDGGGHKDEGIKMKAFDHPNVLALIGVCIDFGEAPYIVMPYMANGSLLSYLKKDGAKLTIIINADCGGDLVRL